MRVRELAEWLSATFEGDGEIELTGVAPIDSAGPSDLAFVGARKAAQQADASTAGCLLVPDVQPFLPLEDRVRAPGGAVEDGRGVGAAGHGTEVAIVLLGVDVLRLVDLQQEGCRGAHHVGAGLDFDHRRVSG